MIGLLIVSAIASGATAFLIGYAFLAPHDSFIRTKTGSILLVVLVLTFLFLPPQLMGIGSALKPLGAQTGSGVMEAFGWPAGLNREVYRFSWILLMIGGLLSGLRIWDVRKPDWRPGAMALASSPVSRAEGLLPLAKSLEEALETLGRLNLAPRDAEHLAGRLRDIGRHFGHQLPEGNGAAYKVVAQYVSPAVAAIVTGHVLEGALRKPGA
ncbi:MAG: hypothetical protein Q8S43_07285 [Actinomycetota bacterium]|nr:MAG: hypothetical protein FD171_992 [Actinomycetota bacterium]MDO8949227.1 hypothetical protein [Actinomycetota bacterium]MDP3630737.1 hypothetical protein [Actinomycetota bacterium]